MDPKRLRVNGVDLTYVEQGSGTPLILVHGSLSDFRSWRGQLGPLSQHFRVVAYSRRYHYPNVWVGNGSDYSAALHADDLAAVIKQLQLGPAHVVGASYGAYTALVLAVRSPKLVRSLVLGEPPLMPWLRWSVEGEAMLENLQATAWEPARQAFRRGNPADAVRAFVDGINGAGTYDRMSPVGRQMLMDNARALEAESEAPEYFTPVSSIDVQQIAVPALLLTGEFSPKLFHTIADELERCLRNPSRAVIAKASHAMHLENPQAYTESVRTFLRTTTIPAVQT